MRRKVQLWQSHLNNYPSVMQKQKEESLDDHDVAQTNLVSIAWVDKRVMLRRWCQQTRGTVSTVDSAVARAMAEILQHAVTMA